MVKEATNKQHLTQIRTCLACRGKQNKYKLLRFVWQDQLVFDREQCLVGRGVYLHPKRRCLALAGKDAKRWKKALKILESTMSDLQIRVVLDQVPQEILSDSDLS